MSLFPAYAPDVEISAGTGGGDAVRQNEDSRCCWTVEGEAALLASDSDSEQSAAAVAPPLSPPPQSRDFYLDDKADAANVGVLTLYYPGRPIYERDSERSVTGGGGGGGGGGDRGAARRRYYARPPSPPPAAPLEVAARARALRSLVGDSPRDPDLWLRYVRFRERWGDAREWLAACEEAAREVRDGGARLRAERHRARRAALAHRDLLDAIARDIAREDGEESRLENWVRLVWAVGEGGGSEGDVLRAAEAALARLSHEPRAYPHLLYAYGAWLRAAGLRERLVLLLELACAVNYPPSRAFPPPPPPSSEPRLRALEDALVDGGLPLSAVWVRVERLRAAAHWRPAPPASPEAEADPQRAPRAAEMAPLVRAVRPAASLLACVVALRLAGVPPLPASETTRRACTAGSAEGAGADGGVGAALPALGRAARRLPPGHAARVGPERAAALRRTLAALLDPPHRFSDEAGYLSWTRALWTAALEWAACERRRFALVCWRLRDLHALVRLAERGGAEARRLRDEARALLRERAAGEPAAFALFARIVAEGGDGAAAVRVAARAVRASAGAAGVSRETALFCARVLRELGGGAGAGEGEVAATRALCCAALGRALPSEEALREPPPLELVRDASNECASRCAELERRWEEASSEAEPDAEVALALGAGGAGEWGAARVALMSPRARRDELQRLRLLGYERVHRSAGALQYYEAVGAALALEAAREAEFVPAARTLRPLFPDNALLALACGGAALWARRGEEGEEEAATAAGGETARWARLLPALLRAPLDDAAAPADMERLSRVCARVAEGAGAGVAALRLEAEARAPRPAAERVLLAALADHPAHKWVYVRGAAWVPAQAEALCDAALERALRTHALLHELAPLAAPAPASAPAPHAGAAPRR